MCPPSWNMLVCVCICITSNKMNKTTPLFIYCFIPNTKLITNAFILLYCISLAIIMDNSMTHLIFVYTVRITNTNFFFNDFTNRFTILQLFDDVANSHKSDSYNFVRFAFVSVTLGSGARLGVGLRCLFFSSNCSFCMIHNIEIHTN